MIFVLLRPDGYSLVTVPGPNGRVEALWRYKPTPATLGWPIPPHHRCESMVLQDPEAGLALQFTMPLPP